MAHVTYKDVQVFLNAELLEIPANDALQEDQTFFDIIQARIGRIYNTSTWTSDATTPALVKRIISMLIAANRYNKVLSEEEDAGNRYANKLEARAYDLLNMLANDELTLYDASLVTIPAGGDPLFYPDDNTGRSEIFNALGELIGPAGSEDHVFTIAMRF